MFMVESFAGVALSPLRVLIFINLRLCDLFEIIYFEFICFEMLINKDFID